MFYDIQDKVSGTERLAKELRDSVAEFRKEFREFRQAQQAHNTRMEKKLKDMKRLIMQ